MPQVLNRGGAARYVEWKTADRISLRLKVEDERVREQASDFDSMEQAFAIVPMQDGSWKQFHLGYSGDMRDRSGVRYDNHTRELTAADGIDLEKIQREGVAFGLSTNRGTLYAQQFGENLRPWPLDD